MGYRVWNGPMPTTAAQASASTGTVIKTMLQLATSAAKQIQIIAWGWSIDTAQSAAGTIELISTDVAASVGTAHVASGIQPFDPNAPASSLQLGAALTGYSFATEGATTAARVHGAYRFNSGGTGASNLMAMDYQEMQIQAPIIAVSKFLRVRATMGTSAGMLCYVEFLEVG